jgi:hypothetical protein
MDTQDMVTMDTTDTTLVMGTMDIIGLQRVPQLSPAKALLM